MAIPTITIGTPSRTKISSITGYDQSTVTFQSDVELYEWETRATTEGQTPGHGVGLLVESGSTLEANTDATVYVDDEELTNGDREYTITVFGHGTDGYWSDGTYEGINVLDLSEDIQDSHMATISGDSITFDTGEINTEGGEIKVNTWKNDWTNVTQYLYEDSLGLKTVNITKTDDFDWVQIAKNGDIVDAHIMIDSSIMDAGFTYTLTFTIDSIAVNHAEISGVSLVKVVV